MVVPTDMLKEVWSLSASVCLSMEDIVDHLRVKTVPYGYTYSRCALVLHVWCTCALLQKVKQSLTNEVDIGSLLKQLGSLS